MDPVVHILFEVGDAALIDRTRSRPSEGRKKQHHGTDIGSIIMGLLRDYEKWMRIEEGCEPKPQGAKGEVRFCQYKQDWPRKTFPSNLG